MKKKKNEKTTVSKQSINKKSNKFKIIIISIFVILAIALITVFAFVNHANNILLNTSWTSTSAKNASNDEVQMEEIYDNNYSSYQGSLNFTEDDKFSLWLTPGTPDDGTHNGTYTINDDKINVVFDDKTKETFKINYKDGSINSIIVPYNNYTVVFTKN